MQGYRFDYETGAYLGPFTLDVSDIDPRSPDTLLIPGDVTLTPPPNCGAGLWPFWRDGAWQVFEGIPDPFFSELDN
jgi:hypothetical protein